MRKFARWSEDGAMLAAGLVKNFKYFVFFLRILSLFSIQNNLARLRNYWDYNSAASLTETFFCLPFSRAVKLPNIHLETLLGLLVCSLAIADIPT